MAIYGKRRGFLQLRLLRGPFRVDSVLLLLLPRPLLLPLVLFNLCWQCIFRKCIFRKCILRKFWKFLAGSFSAVSKRNFARKYAFDSIFQALQDLHPFAPLQSQNFRKKRFEKSAIFVKIQQKNCKCRKICKMLSNFKNFSLRIW